MSFGRGRPFKVILRLIHKDKSVKRLFLNLSQNDADLILKIPLDEFGITKLSPKSSKVLMLGEEAKSKKVGDFGAALPAIFVP